MFILWFSSSQYSRLAGSPDHISAAVPAGVLCVDALLPEQCCGEDERVRTEREEGRRLIHVHVYIHVRVQSVHVHV